MKTTKDEFSPHDPGTPDGGIPDARLKGRRAYRDKLTEPPQGTEGKVEWWLGWYDEELRHWFGR